MKKIILYLMLMFLIFNVVYAEKYFVLDVNYIIGSVTFNSISLREIDRTIRYTDDSGFLVKTVSFENTDIEVIYYNMSENKNYFIYIPYSENAARIEMYNIKNSKIMDIDVSSFSNTCGNNACEEYESYESCTKDCKSGDKDDFCDELKDGICDPDCSIKTDVDCERRGVQGNETASPITTAEEEIKFAEQKEKPNYLIWILLVLAVLIILLFLFIKKRKENQTINSLKQYVNENIRKGFTLQQIKDVLFREGYTQKEVDMVIKN